MKVLIWITSTSAKTGFTISIYKCNLKNAMLTLHCERSAEYKPPKMVKKLELEDTSSRKCGCPSRMHDYFEKKTNEWWLTILNGVHQLSQIICLTLFQSFWSRAPLTKPTCT